MFFNYTDEEILEELDRLSESFDPEDQFLCEMAMLLEDEEHDNKDNGREGVKEGAGELAPKGHQWVYVFIVNAKEITTKVIRHFTKQPYNHSALSFDKSLTNMASFVFPSFKRENIHNYKPEATFSLYKIAVPNEVVLVMKDAVNNIEKAKKDYKYSVIGLLGFIDQRHQAKFNSRENAMFCSQFVARMFATAGMPVFNRPDYTVKPYDFAKNKNFKFCYRGTVKNFDPNRIR